MSKKISRRLAALCSLAVVSGLAGTAAHAAPAASAAPKATVSVRLAPSDGPVVKLGQAILEEYTVTPGGMAVVHETVPGAAQQAQLVPAKSNATTAGRKA